MISVRNYHAKLIAITRLHTRSFLTTSVARKMPTLYGDEASPPVRFVMVTASLLDIKLNFHKIDLFLGENKSGFYTEINPQQKVPALDTGKQIILESHAIALYFCRQTSNRDLYPEDTLLKAKVEQMLFFNSGSLFPVDSSIISDYLCGKPIDCSKTDQWDKLLDYLDLQLTSRLWLAGNEMTLCDLACGTTISSMGLFAPLSQRHARVAEWMNRLQKEPCFDEINKRGITRLSAFIQQIQNHK